MNRHAIEILRLRLDRDPAHHIGCGSVLTRLELKAAFGVDPAT
jgi:hypothetical protein